MKSEPKGRVNLSGALLKNDYIRQGKRASGRAILFSALIALAAGSAGTWYFVWKKGGRSSKTAQQITQNPSYSNQQALQQKFAPLPVAPPAAVAPSSCSCGKYATPPLRRRHFSSRESSSWNAKSGCRHNLFSRKRWNSQTRFSRSGRFCRKRRGQGLPLLHSRIRR